MANDYIQGTKFVQKLARKPTNIKYHNFCVCSIVISMYISAAVVQTRKQVNKHSSSVKSVNKICTKIC